MTTQRPLVVKNRFVMGCWTPAELRWRLRRAGFARVHLLPPARLALPRDRLLAIATRGARAGGAGAGRHSVRPVFRALRRTRLGIGAP